MIIGSKQKIRFANKVSLRLSFLLFYKLLILLYFSELPRTTLTKASIRSLLFPLPSVRSTPELVSTPSIFPAQAVKASPTLSGLSHRQVILVSLSKEAFAANPSQRYV